MNPILLATPGAENDVFLSSRREWFAPLSEGWSWRAIHFEVTR